MYKIETTYQKDGLYVTFSGFLDLSNIEQIRNELLSLDDEKRIIIKMTHVENIDLSFLQLLVAYRKKGARVDFLWDIDDEFMHLIEQSGFKKVLN